MGSGAGEAILYSTKPMAQILPPWIKGTINKMIRIMLWGIFAFIRLSCAINKKRVTNIECNPD